MTPETCEICQGTGWQYQFVPWVNPRVTPCPCVAARKRQQRLDASGIPAEYRRIGFADFRVYNDSLADARRIAIDYAARYPIHLARTDAPGLLFIGPSGVGKTHLAAVILASIIRDGGHYGLFYKTKDLLRLMRNSYNAAIQTTEQSILDPILACDVLVLDDLGAERLTEWVADTMDLIIETRYTAKRATVLTTNFPDLDDIENPDSLLCRVGFRTHSRLYEMCRFVTMAGTDYRTVHPDASDAVLQRLAKVRRPVAPVRHLQRGGPRPTPKDGKGDLKWRGGRAGNSDDRSHPTTDPHRGIEGEPAGRDVL